MKTASAKRKGHKLEALIRDKLISTFKLSEEDVRIPISGEHGMDLKLSKKAEQIFPFKVEAKSYAKFAIYAYMQQAINHKGEHLEPIVIIKGNRQKPLVCLDFDYFLGML